MNSIIIGANSRIAQSIIYHIAPDNEQVMAISSKPLSFDLTNVTCLRCQYTEQDIQNTIEEIKRLNLSSINRIYICNGVLHSNDLQVEKRLEDLTSESIHTIMESNTITPILWLKALLPLVKDQLCKIAVFSARVGSINDNKLGGWYSYRASKAALNMLLKTASIEYARRAKSVKLIAFHPGTTDTPLSRPFHSNINKDKLFTPQFVAEQLEGILDTLTPDGELDYLDWEGKKIEW